MGNHLRPRKQKTRKVRTPTSVLEPGWEATFRHCDEYIDDPTSPEPLRKYLDRARQPAHGMTSSEPYPRLFAEYKGRTVRVVMASRLGDVGITTDLEADLGYQTRVAVSDLANFRETP